ncbi:MAG: HAD hydrolase-like protein, partial [Collinsella sp.]|nr:HAD hydrolase-like protein [Collinsella sp.]
MVRASACGRLFVREGAVSAFPFDAVIFDMDGVIVDTEYYYLGETAAFAKELGLNLTQEELNGQVGTSHQFFLHMLVDWFERAGKGHFTGEEALARWDEWAHKRPRDYQTLIN